MAVSDELEPYESGNDNGEDIGLSARQVQALEWLSANDAEPAPIDPDTKRPVYSKDAKVRAYQMIFEGRFGGPGRGQGRKAKPRAAEHVADEVRKRAGKIVRVLDRGLDSENERLAVDTAIQALKIEREERELQLREEKQEYDLEGATKEEMIASLIELASDPNLAAAIQESSITIPDSEIEEFEVAELVSGNETDSASTSSTGDNPDNATTNGRGSTSRNSSKVSNAFKEAARRRTTD